MKCGAEVTGLSKRLLKPYPALYPLPAVLVSMAGDGGKGNIITVAWTGTVCSEPPMLGVAIRPERYSHGLIARAGEFVVNLPGEGQLHAVDYCGTYSGREVDKFRTLNLTPATASVVAAPLIEECPVNLECRVKQQITLGSHDLFLAEVLAVQAAEDVLDDRGIIDPEKIGPVVYYRTGYWGMGKHLARHGFSKAKK